MYLIHKMFGGIAIGIDSDLGLYWLSDRLGHFVWKVAQIFEYLPKKDLEEHF